MTLIKWLFPFDLSLSHCCMSVSHKALKCKKLLCQLVIPDIFQTRISTDEKKTNQLDVCFDFGIQGRLTPPYLYMPLWI